jgi:hypothetical protein
VPPAAGTDRHVINCPVGDGIHRAVEVIRALAWLLADTTVLLDNPRPL